MTTLRQAVRKPRSVKPGVKILARILQRMIVEQNAPCGTIAPDELSQQYRGDATDLYTPKWAEKNGPAIADYYNTGVKGDAIFSIDGRRPVTFNEGTFSYKEIKPRR